jgi:hypothetical protein
MRAFRRGRDGGWDGRRSNLSPIELNIPFPWTNVAKAQSTAPGKEEY